ncbi:hypothetical protein BB560_000588 [Smittium megazygosporum]|uniref:RING-type E3 ubiquitin transferase n=1 Tax=Smittium megazygosporum TaxID=133381 RepID=A0A2T9YDA8_9FUNG|nr:hypothetical protein BB560_006206 [Smittium megazygosporum]PVV04880.1 hypothetical protein BB560_000588 [Smittium megazygosporum]
MFVNAFPAFFSCLVGLYMFQASGTLIFLESNATLYDQQAAFGPKLLDIGLTAPLEIIGSSIPGDEYGCSQISKFRSEKPKWIALVKRGRCSFVKKVHTLQQLGASAVIVADPIYDTPIIMYSPVYNSVLNEFKSNNGSLVIKLLPNSDVDPLDEILIIIKTLAIIFFFLSAFCFWLRNYQSRTYDLAPSTLVSTFPTREFFTSKTTPDSDTECPICLEDYHDSDELRILPCKHEFHSKCIVFLFQRNY